MFPHRGETGKSSERAGNDTRGTRPSHWEIESQSSDWESS
jgi:hypothetical protein